MGLTSFQPGFCRIFLLGLWYFPVYCILKLWHLRLLALPSPHCAMLHQGICGANFAEQRPGGGGCSPRGFIADGEISGNRKCQREGCMEKPVFSFHAYLEPQQSSKAERYVQAMILSSFHLNMCSFSGRPLSQVLLGLRVSAVAAPTSSRVSLPQGDILGESLHSY